MNRLGIAAGRCGANVACIWRNMKAEQVTSLLTQPFNGTMVWAMISDDQKLVCNGSSATLSSVAFVLIPVFGITGDTNCDAHVNKDDLLEVIRNWGECAGCDADFDRDFRVGVNDLIHVIVHWSH